MNGLLVVLAALMFGVAVTVAGYASRWRRRARLEGSYDWIVRNACLAYFAFSVLLAASAIRLALASL